MDNTNNATEATEAVAQTDTPTAIIGLDITESEQLVSVEEQGIEVEVDDLRGRPVFQADGVTPIAITVVGSLSKRYQKVQAIQRGRMIRGVQKRGVVEEETDETLGLRNMHEQTEAVAGCILRWTPGFTATGKDFAFSQSNALRLLRANPHIQTKLEKAMTDHERFFARSSTSSPT